MIVESYEDVIVLSGALRANQWETIHTAISLTLQRYPTGVIIDCSGLQECNPMGAETFRSALNFIEEQDARVIVASVSPAVEDVLQEVADVRSRLPLAPTVEAARQSLNLLGEHVNVEDIDPKKAKKDGAGLSKVILLLSGQPYDRHTAQVAAGYSLAVKAQVNLVYPVLIPRELPLNAPLPEEEAKASEILNSMEDWFEQEEVPVARRVSRGRDIGTALEEAVEELDADQVFVGLPTHEDDMDAALKMSKIVLSRVHVPVHLVRGKH